MGNKNRTMKDESQIIPRVKETYRGSTISEIKMKHILPIVSP
jgi:hypothetical protein